MPIREERVGNGKQIFGVYGLLMPNNFRNIRLFLSILIGGVMG